MATGPLVILAVIPPRTTPNTGGVQTDGEATHNRSVAGSRPASPTPTPQVTGLRHLLCLPGGVLLLESYGAMVTAARAGGRAIPELWPLGTEALAPATRTSAQGGPVQVAGCADRTRVNGGLGVRWTVGWVAATATPGLAARSGRRPPAARSTGCPARSGHAGGAEPRHRPGSVIAAPVETSVDQALDAPPPRTRRTTPPRPPSRRGDQAIVAPPLARPERPAPISVTRLSPSA
jgi:hypothetical protein